MLLNYVKIIGLPVIDLRNQEKTGEISDLIYQDDLKIASFVLKSGSMLWHEKTRIIPFEGAVAITKKGIIINDENCVALLDDSVRFKKLADKKYYGLGQSVVTKSGKNLGSVYDYLINSATSTITKLYIKNLWSERIIPAGKITGIEKGKFIIKDEFESIGLKDLAADTAAVN